eukprot:5555043-Prymnesium_polylepis.1
MEPHGVQAVARRMGLEEPLDAVPVFVHVQVGNGPLRQRSSVTDAAKPAPHPVSGHPPARVPP